MPIFSRLFAVEFPQSLCCEASGTNPAFAIRFRADGEIPFPQVILRGEGVQKLLNGEAIELEDESESNESDESEKVWTYVASVPAGLMRAQDIGVQVEGCRKADLSQAGGADWVKEFATLKLRPLSPAPGAKPWPRVGSGGGRGGPVKLYFGIHKHMHQPYYNTTDRSYWDGEKEAIFGSRAGNYTRYLRDAVQQYIDGELPHAGLSTSWSGSLIEQLDRCAADGLCGGQFAGWANPLRSLAGAQTSLGNPRVAFSAFGFFHPLMALIPSRDIARQIEWHRGIIRNAFGVEASKVLFPPETAFHVRMIPALLEAGVTAVIYDSIHRFRACKDYPYAGPSEGLLPPNRAEQTNAPVGDWLQLQNIWAGSRISPSLLRPEYVAYEDPDGKVYRIVAVPAERYIGNEDARGGFGALQYASVLGQVCDRIVETGSFDPLHPPFFLLHSDGDNHGGGADSYFHQNTGRLVQWLKEDSRFELTTVEDYVQRFPPDPTNTAHLEPGSWSGADNGDPQFMKWFSRCDQPYSPDLNSWAVLTAFQNAVHTVEDCEPAHSRLAEAVRLLLTAETSCYWYWTGQEVWDRQVTNAANLGYGMLRDCLDGLVARKADRTGPTIFAPWVTPANPGGKRWGQGGLLDAPREGTVHTFVHDVSGLTRVSLVLRTASGETRATMTPHGPYPSQTGASQSAGYFTAQLPVGAGDLRYFIEAQDALGNTARGSLERIFVM